MISFISSFTGDEIKVLTERDKYNYRYFYNIKARFLNNGEYCYCTLICENKIIADMDKICDYGEKIITTYAECHGSKAKNH